MSRTNQLLLWVAGRSVHDKESDLCCPDHSCCNKIFFISDVEIRSRYLKAYAQDDFTTVKNMYKMFVSRLMLIKKTPLKEDLDDFRTLH